MKLIKLPSGDWVRPNLIAAIMTNAGALMVVVLLVSNGVTERIAFSCASESERNKLAFQIAEACNG